MDLPDFFPNVSAILVTSGWQIPTFIESPTDSRHFHKAFPMTPVGMSLVLSESFSFKQICSQMIMSGAMCKAGPVVVIRATLCGAWGRNTFNEVITLTPLYVSPILSSTWAFLLTLVLMSPLYCKSYWKNMPREKQCEPSTHKYASGFNQNQTRTLSVCLYDYLNKTCLRKPGTMLLRCPHFVKHSEEGVMPNQYLLNWNRFLKGRRLLNDPHLIFQRKQAHKWNV